jgi:uncharacterized membrane protein
MQDSSWRLLGAILAVLGAAFLIASAIAYAENVYAYVAGLVVFGGIFLVFGAGLVAITIFEKPADKSETAIPPPP